MPSRDGKVGFYRSASAALPDRTSGFGGERLRAWVERRARLYAEEAETARAARTALWRAERGLS